MCVPIMILADFSPAPFALLGSTLLPLPHGFLQYEATKLLPCLLLRLPLLLILWALCENLVRRLLGLQKRGPIRLGAYPPFRFILMAWMVCGPLILLSTLWWRLGGHGWASFTATALRIAAASCLWVWPEYDQGMITSSSFLFRYVARWWRAALTGSSVLALAFKALGLPLLPLEQGPVNELVSILMSRIPRRRAIALARLCSWAYLAYFFIAFLPHSQFLRPNLEPGKASPKIWGSFRINEDRQCLPLSERFRWPKDGEAGTFAAAPRDDPWFEHDRALKQAKEEKALRKSRMWSVHQLREEMISEGKDPDAEYEAVVKAERGRYPPLLSQSAGYHRYLSLVLGHREPDVRDLSLLKHMEEGGDEAVLRSNLVRYRIFMDHHVANRTASSKRDEPAVSPLGEEGEFFLVKPSQGEPVVDSMKSLDDASVLESLLFDDRQAAGSGGAMDDSEDEAGAGVGATLFNLLGDTKVRLSPGALARLGAESGEEEGEEEDEDDGEATQDESDDEYAEDDWSFEESTPIPGLPGALPIRHSKNAMELLRSPVMTDTTYRFSLLHPNETEFDTSVVGVYMSQLPQTIYSGLVLDLLSEIQRGPVGTWARDRKIPLGYLTATLTEVLSHHLQDVMVAVSDAILFPVVPVRQIVPVNFTLVKDSFEQSLRMDAPDAFYQRYNCTATVGARWRTSGRTWRGRFRGKAISEEKSLPTTPSDPEDGVMASGRLTYGRGWARSREKKRRLWGRVGETLDGLILRIEVLLEGKKEKKRMVGAHVRQSDRELTPDLPPPAELEDNPS